MEHVLIDVQHHANPLRVSSEEIQEHVPTGVVFDMEKDLEDMARCGIQAAVLSVPLDIRESELTRKINEGFAGMIADHPTRIGAFANIPLADIDAALIEIEYALDVLGLDGVGMVTTPMDLYLGDPYFDPVFDELDRRGAVVFVHPYPPEASKRSNFKHHASMIDFPLETTKTATDMVLRGVMNRYSRMRVILCHAGGTIPFLAGRIDLESRVPVFVDGYDPEENYPRGVMHHFRQFYYDVALSAFPAVLDLLAGFADRSHILFATDYPMVPVAQILEAVETITSVTAFGDRALDTLCQNGLRLFPRFG